MRRKCALALLAVLGFASLGLDPSARANKLSPQLRHATRSAGAEDEFVVWIYFTDKGPKQASAYAATLESLTPRSRKRRLKVRSAENVIDIADLPLEESYVAAIRPHLRRLRHRSKWLNAVSARATLGQINRIRAFGFVKFIDLVARFKGRKRSSVDLPSVTGRGVQGAIEAQTGLLFDYGPSLSQLDQINVPSLHNQGIFGQGVMIGLFDAGFNNLGHDAFQMMNIVATHDFVNGDADVSNNGDMGDGSHGTWTLSVIGGFAEGQLIGPAFGADYILAKTENTESELPVEEDHWVAALEWAEGLGVDIVSSSLGYLSFDRPFDGYTWKDMDGHTAVTTRAAVMAVARGITVVTAAGNFGGNPRRNTLAAPADGPGVITVGAVNRRGARAVFSSVGPTVDGRIKPDVMARGVRVRVASHFDRQGYLALDGTSFATPLVAGTVALLLSAHPNWSPAQVLEALRRTASNHTTPNNLIGWGIIDAHAAAEVGDLD